MIDWLIGWSLTSCEHASSYMRCPCKGHGIGCLWLLLPKPTQEVTSDMKFTEWGQHLVEIHWSMAACSSDYLGQLPCPIRKIYNKWLCRWGGMLSTDCRSVFGRNVDWVNLSSQISSVTSIWDAIVMDMVSAVCGYPSLIQVQDRRWRVTWNSQKLHVSYQVHLAERHWSMTVC